MEITFESLMALRSKAIEVGTLLEWSEVALEWMRAANEEIARKKGVLTFAELSVANSLRVPRFRNALGQLSHPQDSTPPWSIAEWTNAICGEAGEAANIAKKLRRGDFLTCELSGAHLTLGKELADVVIYTDITAQQIGLDLGELVRSKFNEVSDRIGESEIKI